MSTMTTSGPPGVRLDAAIERALNAPSVDGVSRVQLTEMRGALADGRGTSAHGGIGPDSLTDALMTFVMPRLRHPEVLNADRHRALLERLADALAGEGEDNVVTEGAFVVRRELKRLALLRQHRNSLVEG